MKSSKPTRSQTSKTPQKNGQKPKKSTQAPCRNLPHSMIDDNLSQLDTSIEPLKETFIFRPNQNSDDEESEISFVATECSWAEGELSQEIEREIFQSSCATKSQMRNSKIEKNSLENISADKRKTSTVKLPNQFKNTRSFKQSQDFEVKNQSKNSMQRSFESTSRNKKSKVPAQLVQTKKSGKKTVTQTSEEEIIVPQKIEYCEPEPEIQLSKQTLSFDALSKPAKKLKTDSSNNNRPLLKFTVDIKLLKPKEKVRKVVKLVNSGKIKSMEEALFSVEIEGEKKPKVMNNVEMTHFYQDALIDFYQANPSKDFLQK